MRGVAVVLCLLLAGCSGFAATDPGAETPTVTAVPLEGAATPTGGGTLAPGVTEEGVTSPLLLARAHAVAVETREHSFVHQWRVAYANGTVRGEVRQRAAVVPDGAFTANLSVRGRTGIVGNRPTVAEFWSNGTEMVERARTTQLDGNTTVRYIYLPSEQYAGGSGFYNSLRRPKPWLDLYVVFASVDAKIAARQAGDRPGQTVYLFEATDVTEPDALAAATGFADPRNLTLVGAVTDEGAVRGYRLTFDATLDGEPVEVTRDVRYDFRDVTVERPEWYETAINESIGGSRGSVPSP
ncbi:hypothetical protein N0B31_18595 [Salinirubellus salinus]|uniref:Lipoprotein n=1 Tax=Salinirubellus salinus TaxID=1364945 RepID=A0A9E7R3H9_9EURY|nr:hypothetical protein [Salinirubellus salinus]UWM54113.1 hypothetical protein N0B31_18595 [Salinirubellus salinus]